MRILATGGTGRLGKQLVKLDPDIYAPTRQEMDITNNQQVHEVITSYVPEIIIHCAALTNVVQCEHMKDLAWKVNVEGTANILDSCFWGIGSYFIYVSTACVFRGTRGNYCELDTPYPTNFYGVTKLTAETLVRYSGLPEWLIVRTNFVERGRWPHRKAFTDRLGTWLYTDQVSEHILDLTVKRATGIKHVCAKKKRTMYELAREDPENSHVQPTTLQHYYKHNPTSPRLTRDMSLISVVKTKQGCC